MRRRQIESWLLAACDPWTHAESPRGALTPIELHAALESAKRHGVLGAALQSLDRWQQQAVGGSEFRQQHLNNVGKTLGLRLIAKTVVEQLAAAGIPCCLLKGEDFASRLYPNSALRPYRDVDVLVPLPAMREADRLIQSLGYEPVEPERKYQAHEYGQISYLASGPERWSVELHWNIINSPAQRQVCSLTFEDFDVEAPNDAGGPWLLSPTSLLVLAAVHACIGHRFDSLQQLCDIRQICRGGAGPVDAELLSDMCRLRGCETPLRWSLDLAARLLGCDHARELTEQCDFSPRAVRPFGMLGRQTVLRPQTTLSRLRRSWARVDSSKRLSPLTKLPTGTKPMRALILGSPVPQTARTVWRWLAAGHEIDEVWCPRSASGVWWRRDRRLRWLAPTWSLTAAVRRFGLRLRTVGPLARDPRTVAEGLRPHIDVVLGSCFAYRVPEEMLAYYRDRVCNLHPALLPRYRGVCPMLGMLFDEDLSASGMTLHLMQSKFDAGDVIAQEPVAWPEDNWFRTWEADLAETAGRLAVEALPQFLKGSLSAQPQRGAGNYMRKLPAGGLVLNERMDERRARWLGSTLGRIKPLEVEGPRGLIPVTTVLASHAKSASRSPEVGWRRVQCDVADARISVRRWSRISLRAERFRELAALARRPLAA